MEITQKIALDLACRTPSPRLDMKQGDVNSRVVEIALSSAGESWTPPQGTQALVRYRKADGTAGIYDTLPDGVTAGVSLSGSTLTVRLAPQMLTAAGMVCCDVVLRREGRILATFDFWLAVAPDPVGKAELESQDYYRVVTLDQINAALDGKLSLAGGSMTGALDMGGNQVQDVGAVAFGSGGYAIGYDEEAQALAVRDRIGAKPGRMQVGQPKYDADAATKAYVDTACAGGGAGGENGGYYLPAVDGSGNLSWQASKDGMPAVAEKNIRGPKGDPGNKGDKGDPGESGATYTPSVSEDGTLSWTNDKGLTNPAPVNIKGAKGDKGEDGTGGSAAASGPVYGTCATSAATAAKVVSASGFTLSTGASVLVKFTNQNTSSAPTLNVNSTGAKAIKKYGSTAPDTYQWAAGAVVQFVYDGSYWVMVGGTTATTTTAGVVKLSSSTSDSSTTKAATPNAVKAAYDKAVQAYDLASSASGGSGGGIPFYTCTVAAATETKTMQETYGNTMAAGTLFAVWFVNSNEAASPVLSVEGKELQIVNYVMQESFSPTDIKAGIFLFIVMQGGGAAALLNPWRF